MSNPDTLPFGDRLDQAVREKKSVAVVGIDPTPAAFPPEIREMAASGPQGLSAALSEYCLGIIGAVADLVPAVKPNIAFFEAFGMHGFPIYKSICLAADSAGLLVIGDVKRGDIGSTAAAYASGLLDAPRVDLSRLTGISDHAEFEKAVGVLLGPHDALTLNPYLGSDSIKPFIDRGLPRGQGFFVLVQTSNASSSEIQDLRIAGGGTVAEAVARLVDDWGGGSIGKSGLSSIGAVVGATHPDKLARFRELMPAAPFLIPGYGAQGGTAADVVGAFRKDGSGALVNASRGILQAWKKSDNPANWRAAARQAAMDMNADLRQALSDAGKWGY